MNRVQLVEQTVINESDPRYAAIDTASFAAKNLYNLALYEMRQSFIHEGIYLGYAEVYHRVKHSEAYQALPRKVSNDVLRQLDKAWRSFRAAMKEWYEHPEKFGFSGIHVESSFLQNSRANVESEIRLSDRSFQR